MSADRLVSFLRYISISQYRLICSDALAENFSCRKFQETEFYSLNLLAVVGFTKMLAKLFSYFLYFSYFDLFALRKRKELSQFPVLRYFAEET